MKSVFETDILNKIVNDAVELDFCYDRLLEAKLNIHEHLVQALNIGIEIEEISELTNLSNEGIYRLHKFDLVS